MQEEKSKQDVKLKYSCKCSFLEIYNEQITDLLEPSSTNLQVILSFLNIFCSGFYPPLSLILEISKTSLIVAQGRLEERSLRGESHRTQCHNYKRCRQASLAGGSILRFCIPLPECLFFTFLIGNMIEIFPFHSQGAANRKMAATYMNSESSRSHSVFTCIIESHWEKDSRTHFRFARLNLVDLAGSER